MGDSRTWERGSCGVLGNVLNPVSVCLCPRTQERPGHIPNWPTHRRSLVNTSGLKAGAGLGPSSCYHSQPPGCDHCTLLLDIQAYTPTLHRAACLPSSNIHRGSPALGSLPTHLGDDPFRLPLRALQTMPACQGLLCCPEARCPVSALLGGQGVGEYRRNRAVGLEGSGLLTMLSGPGSAAPSLGVHSWESGAAPYPRHGGGVCE